MSEQTHTIALVADPFMESRSIREKLEAEGFRVEMIQPGANLPDRLAVAKPEIIITDLDLSNPHDPFGVLSALKNDERFRETEIFVYSEVIDVKTEIELRKLRLHSYFTKSDKINYLIDAARQQFIHYVMEEDMPQWEQDAAMMRYQAAYAEAGDGDTTLTLGDDTTADLTKSDDTKMFSDMLSELHEGLDKKLAMDEAEFEKSYNTGVAYFKSGLFAQALAEFEKCSHSPAFAEKCFIMIGSVHRKTAEFDKAIETFKTGFKETQNPYSKLDFLYEMGDTYELQGKLGEAYKMFGAIYKQTKNYKDVKARLIAIKNAMDARNKL